MDADRFDSLTRTLTDFRTRRTLLGVAFAGMLAALGLDNAEDAAAKNCKKIKDKKKRKKCLAQAKDPADPCAGIPAGAPCPPCKRADTVCGPPSNTGDPSCCSGYCNGTGPNISGFCYPGYAGDKCYTYTDCWDTACINYRCVQAGPGGQCYLPEHCLSGNCNLVTAECL